MPLQPDRSALYVDASGFVDVARLIAAYSAEEHAARADQYFEAIDDPWAFHLKKPFQNPDDARVTLAGLSAVLALGEIRPGDVVVDFGCGAGWLTAALGLMRCRAVGLDISPAALRIARTYVDSLPALRGAPVRFEVIGESLPLADGSVDRVICFDAFHHVRDQAATLAEFARVLRPGGLAVFHEPGPEHSRTPVSQMEMREFAVIENDVVVERLWEIAAGLGFSEMRLAAFTDRPLPLPLEGLGELIAGAGPQAAYEALGRAVAAQVGGKRVFRLRKPGVGGLDSDNDSRSREGLGGRVEVLDRVDDLAAGEVRVVLEVTNTGRNWWRPSGADDGAVNLGAKVVRADGQSVDLNRAAVSDTPVSPGESRRVEMTVPLPSGADAGCDLRIDLVSEMIAWFFEVGSPGTPLPHRRS